MGHVHACLPLVSIALHHSARSSCWHQAGICSTLLIFPIALGLWSGAQTVVKLVVKLHLTNDPPKMAPPPNFCKKFSKSPTAASQPKISGAAVAECLIFQYKSRHKSHTRQDTRNTRIPIPNALGAHTARRTDPESSKMHQSGDEEGQ